MTGKSVAVQRGLGAYSPELGGDQVDVEVHNVPVSLIDTPSHIQERELDKNNVRHLADSIRAEGRLLQPITVQRSGERFELEFGRHRLEAFRALGLEEIPAQVWDLQDRDKAAGRIAENVVRRQMPPFEEAQAFQELHELGDTHEQIADRTGVSLGTVKNRMKLLNLPLEVARLVDGEKVRLQDAQLVAGLKDNPKALKIGVDLLQKGRVNEWNLRHSLEAAGIGTDVDDYRVQDRVGYNQEFKKEARKLPHLKIGSGPRAHILVTDKKAFKELVKEHEKKRTARSTSTSTSTPRASAAEKREALERRYVLELEQQAAARSIQSMMTPAAPREEGEIVQHALHFRVERKADWTWLETATGVPLETLQKIVRNYPRPDLDEIKALAAKDELTVWRVLAGVSVLRNMERSPHMNEHGLAGEFCKAYTKKTPAQWRALAKAKAKAEMAKKKPAKKAAKKTSKKSSTKRPKKRPTKKRATKKKARRRSK